jgi:hypothetical protein
MAFTHDIPRVSGAVMTCWVDTPHRLFSAPIHTDGMEEQCVGVVLRVYIQPDARVADGELWDEIRCLYGEEIKKVPLPLLEIRSRPHDKE